LSRLKIDEAEPASILVAEELGLTSPAEDPPLLASRAAV
jgi:hypothetical protein